MRLFPESDFAGGVIHGFHDGERFQADSHVAELLSAGLKPLFYGDSHALQRGTRGADQLHQSCDGAAVGKKLIDDPDMVLRGEKLL